MNKGLTLITLLGAVAAVPSTRDNQGTSWFTKFPNYSDNVAATFATTLTACQLMVFSSTSVKLGGYQCARKGQFFVFPQTVTTFLPVTAPASVTFYGAEITGATQGTVTLVTLATDSSSCGNTVFQNSAVGSAATNGGLGMMTPAETVGGTMTVGKVFYQGMLNEGVDWTFMVSTTRVEIRWNPDFLLASMYQLSAATPSATDFCTVQAVALATATTVATSQATAGLSGTQKCTFQATSTAAMGAPSMKLNSAGSIAFQFQWAEWESGVLVAGTSMVGTNATPLWLGTTVGEWPNPIMSWETDAVATSTISPAYVNGGAGQPYEQFDSNASGYAASPGLVKWWPSSAGLSLTTASSTMDFLQLSADYASYTTMANTYNTAKSDYETKKTAYNSALADEKTRQADFFKAMFEPAVAIPERPCQPTRPDAFSGIDFKYATTVATTDPNKLLMQGTFTSNTGVQAAAASYKLGYQLPATGSAWAAGAAHTYGLLGQGTAQYSSTVTAFQWFLADAAKTHHMMVSILPYSSAMAALTAVIEVGWKNAVFSTNYAGLSKPGQPGATTAPDAVGAKALAASVVAVAAVAASLF